MAKNKKPSIWNEQTFDILEKMLDEGFGPQKIADALSRATNTVVSRSAVISKVHRSGLEFFLKSPKIKKDNANKKVILMKKCAKEVTTAKENRVLSVETVLHTSDAVLHLRHSQCRWPHGNPRTAEFRFCENTRINNSPYCNKHHRAAYRT